MDTSLWLIMTKKDGRGMSEEVTKSQGNNKFLKGTLILTISSIVVKVIGALKRAARLSCFPEDAVLHGAPFFPAPCGAGPLACGNGPS